MPELPEVEVVRRGLADHVLNRRIASVQVFNPRAIRRHDAGAADFIASLTGQRFSDVQRRGKFMWLRWMDSALVVHLGMSGQMLVRSTAEGVSSHCRILFSFDRPKSSLIFDDQRTFGGMHVDALVTAPDGREVPLAVAHIAPDPFEPSFNADRVVEMIRSRRTSVKSSLLNQEVVSGIGNIYADEALWRTKLNWRSPGDSLSRPKVRSLLEHAQQVMAEALDQGGTSFDALYVNINGQSGYFSRSLNAYGREGEPCARCGSLIVREPFANRSSYRCPRCQRR
jgi:formamidopyrimidine-DNA glycosylase